MAATFSMTGEYFTADCSQYFPDRYAAKEWKVPACILVWGCNPVYSNPDGFLGSWVVRCLRLGSKLIVVDPRETWLASRADVWLRLRPGTDGALALAFLHHLLVERPELVDREFTGRWVRGIDAVRELVRSWSADRAGSVCGVDPNAISKAAALYASSSPSALQWGVAIDMSRSAVGTAHALTCLAAITGNLDVPGGNVFVRDPGGIPRRGVPRELFESLEAERIGAATYPLIRTGFPYAHADCLLDQLETGEPYPVKAAWIQGTNTTVSSFADPARAHRLLKSLEFTVVLDLFMTPTAAHYADVVLPVATYVERNGLRNWWYQLAAINRAVEPLEGVLSDQQIVLETGKRLAPGLFPWSDVESWFDSILEPSGLTFEELSKKGWVTPGTGYRRYSDGGLRPDGIPGFRTESGLVELDPATFEQAGLPSAPFYVEPPTSPVSTPELLQEYPLVLTTGARLPWFFHSEHRSVGALRERHPVPEVEISSRSARRCGVETGEWVWLSTPHGRCLRRALVSRIVPDGTLHTTHGWWIPSVSGAGEEGMQSGLEQLNVNNLLPSHEQGLGGLGYSFRSMLCRLDSADMDGAVGALAAHFERLSPPESRGIPLREISVSDHSAGSRELLATEPDWCSGCRTCEIACLEAHGLSSGTWGIVVLQAGEDKGPSFEPVPTDLCDLCSARVGDGPSCVRHCPSDCIRTGPATAFRSADASLRFYLPAGGKRRT
jgi:anaerobic selenocysteine-containing dehydrogenase/ferredoxin